MPATSQITHRYLSPWSPDPFRKPEYFTTTMAPVEYRGFHIFQRLPKSHELVKDGVCLTQRAGGGELRSLVDALCGDRSRHPRWLVKRAREIATLHGVKLPTRAMAA